MNALQLYYTQKVLGVQSALKPQDFRSIYSLSHPLAKKTDFLFFCNQLKTSSEKTLIQNIAKALKTEAEQVVEILDVQNPHCALLFKNLLARFNPKAFVIFGEKLAGQLFGASSNQTGYEKSATFMVFPTSRVDKKQELSNKISKKGEFTMAGVVIHSIHQLTNPDPVQKQKAKQEAWQVLHKTFRLK